MMTPAERHQRLAEIITVQDELAAAFMQLDLLVHELMHAEFCEPPAIHRPPVDVAGIATPLPRIRRAK